MTHCLRGGADNQIVPSTSARSLELFMDSTCADLRERVRADGGEGTQIPNLVYAVYIHMHTCVLGVNTLPHGQRQRSGMPPQ